MPFIQQLPEWNNPGTEPPQPKKDAGWIAGDKPPADWLNWLSYRAHQALLELQQKAAEKSTLDDHVANKTNPHSVSKSQVGLSDVDNTSDANKPISTATQTALNNKVDKVTGKQLSTEDYTTAEKNKLTGVEAGANNYVHLTGDGNLHVPATGTTNNGKVLKAGSTAGSLSWSTLTAADIGALASGSTAAAAIKLETARTISLTGDVSGSVTFDGTDNASITATVADDSHAHVITNVDGLQVALDAKETPTGAQVKVDTHASDEVKHLTASERTTWNGKASTSVATTSTNGLMSSTDKSKLDGVATNANNYLHPANHPASIITEDTTHRFVTDTEKVTWNGKASTARATQAADGLMSATDKTKLDGVAQNANNYTHPASHPATMISVADSGNHFTAVDVEGALSELFTLASDGKNSIATAITGKGVSASGGDTFGTLATKIGQIDTMINSWIKDVWATNSSGNMLVAKGSAAAAGTQSAAVCFGGTTGTWLKDTEKFNGTIWSTSGDLNVFRYSNSGSGTQSAAFTFGGASGVTSENFNGSVWTVSGNLSFRRDGAASAGTQTAGLAIGGYSSGYSASVESYNGSTWSVIASLSTGRSSTFGSGTANAAFVAGGYNNANLSSVEKFNGTTWAATGALNALRTSAGAGGDSTAGVVFGGENTTPYYNTTEKFNGTSWSASGTLSIGKRNPGGAGSQSRALCIGGDDVTHTYVATTEKFYG